MGLLAHLATTPIESASQQVRGHSIKREGGGGDCFEKKIKTKRKRKKAEVSIMRPDSCVGFRLNQYKTRL